MEIRIDFGRLLAHDRWANDRALASVEALPSPPARTLVTLGHFLGAEACWLSRMSAGIDPPDWERWESLDAVSLRIAWREELPALWAAFLADPALSDPSREFTYVNFLGETGRARVEDVLLQLMLHSAYHRGQVALAVRAAGGEPAVVDFLHAVRSGALPR